ncbi:MAG TPA: zinc ribbon domain-containing protein [Solirubrobacteraceae bacterium]|jgi:hypothetical protein|nr:zinc ribbon domain-containing protein [Solirubrobacteraceae bacterium]
MSGLKEALSRKRAAIGRPPPDQAVQSQPRDEQSAELRRRRDALAHEVTELHWDLGGLAYEMAIRDHFRLDVIVRRAALLQQRDAELAELERLLALQEDGAAGACSNCGAPHSRGAAYCWQCGTTLTNPGAVDADGDGHAAAGATDDASTAVMEALFSAAATRSRPARDTKE